MADESNIPDRLELQRHYLKIRDGADVDPKLRAYCGRAKFHSYSAADAARRKMLEEYWVADTTTIEVAFRR